MKYPRQIAGILVGAATLALTAKAAPADNVVPNLPMPSPASTSSTSTKPITEADALKQFADADAARAAAAVGTQERANAAQKAADLASTLAWMDFDAGKYDEAAGWFTKHADLTKEMDDNQSAYVEAQCKQSTDIIDAKLKSADASTKPIWRQISTTLQIACTVNQEMLASNRHDTQKRLDLDRHELDLRKQALQELQAAGSTRDKIDEATVNLANCMEGIGGSEADLGQYDDAEKMYRDALAIRESLQQTTPNRDLDSPLSDLAKLYADEGNYPRAKDYYLQAIAAIQADPNRKTPPPQDSTPELKTMWKVEEAMEEAKVLNNTGVVLSNMGDYKGDMEYMQRALKVVDTIPTDGVGAFFHADMRLIDLANIAALKSDTGQIDDALKDFLGIIDGYKAIGDENGAAVTLSNVAGIYDEKGDYEKSRRYEEQARSIFMSEQDLQHVILVDLHLSALARRTNDLAKSEEYADQAMLLAKKNGSLDLTSSAERCLANVRIKQGRFADADKLLAEAESIDKTVGAPLNSEYTFDLQGQSLEGEGKQAAALDKFKAAINLLESVRSTSTASDSDFGSLQNNYLPYEHIVKLLIKMGKTEDAFDYLSRAKSKQLQDTLSVSSIKTGNKALQQLLDRAGALQTKLQAVQGQIEAEQQKPADQRDDAKIKSLQVVVAKTQGEYYDVSDQIRDKYPDYDEMLTVKPTELASAQDAIPSDAVLIEYAPLGDQLYIFTVTNDSLKIYNPPVKPDDLWALIADTRKKIEMPGDTDFTIDTRGARRANVNPASTAAEIAPVTDDLIKLYDMLITPIEPEIANKKTLLFVPTHQLYYLPMQALARKTPNGLRFLIQDKQIVYLAAADVMSVVEPRHGALGTGMTAIGDPTGAHLPFAGDEVEAISHIFTGSDVLIGSQATKAAVENPSNWDRRVLHFATHGILDSAMPRDSYIQLAQSSNPEDSELTVGEIYGLPLSKVDLVTISACETALGEKHPGSEILSLATAFSRAKARSVVASLWSVSDDSTKVLMVEFYKQLAAGKSKAAALQAAEIKVMSMPEYKHPFYWAPFILMGDWR